MQKYLSPQSFAEIGEALRGPNWRTWLAERLRKSERQIRRYENGAKIPRGVREDLLELIRAQKRLLADWERDMSA